MKIILGSDHAGIEGRHAAAKAANEAGHEATEIGPDEPQSVDYPDLAHRVAAAIQSGEADRGVLVCGTGQGMAMAANRHSGVRAAVLTDEMTTQMSRAHNNANVACFGERVIGVERIAELSTIFFETEFEGDRHTRRVSKIELQA